MKNRHTLSAVLLTALIAGLAYVGISLGPVARVASPAELSLGQAPTAEPLPLAKPVAVAVASYNTFSRLIMLSFYVPSCDLLRHSIHTI
mgnify:CR=1 FL=1